MESRSLGVNDLVAAHTHSKQGYSTTTAIHAPVGLGEESVPYDDDNNDNQIVGPNINSLAAARLLPSVGGWLSKAKVSFSLTVEIQYCSQKAENNKDNEGSVSRTGSSASQSAVKKPLTTNYSHRQITGNWVLICILLPSVSSGLGHLWETRE